MIDLNENEFNISKLSSYSLTTEVRILAMDDATSISLCFYTGKS